jgi:hypothetical protein
VEDQKPTKFSDLEPRILAALQQKGNTLGLTEEPMDIVGMTSIMMQDDLGTYQIGGKSIPAVVVVGHNTGRVYQFAIKALLPDVDI